MTGSEIRARFLEYFRQRGHTVVRSSPLVPAQDPTLLFTNAGMVQFKCVFLGEERRDYVRATTAQKCVRAGGKHNDLENVGRTARHHTFFEMLGNFSFGDYFKKDAIAFCWEFLTQDFGLPEDRLRPPSSPTTRRRSSSGSSGRPRRAHPPPGREGQLLGDGRHRAVRAVLGDPLPPGRRLALRRGEGGPEAAGAACDCDRWLEIWNLVFMQFEREASGALMPLPKPSIDTGMGLERVAAVVQGKMSSYDTDLFAPADRAIAAPRAASPTAARGGRRLDAGDRGPRPRRDVPHHRRRAPSNEGRGYVLRRIMRRAMRHGRKLGLNEPFLCDMTRGVVELMGDAYPEIREAPGPRGRDGEGQEEEHFAETLDLGMAKIEPPDNPLRQRNALPVAGQSFPGRHRQERQDGQQ